MIKSEPRKILLLTTSLAPGGAETVVAQLAAALGSGDCAVTVVSMLEPTAFADELEAAGVAVVSLGMRRGRPNLMPAAKFFAYLHRHRPELIHAHMYHASILARLARMVTGIPVICTVHSEVECSHRRTSSPIREWTYRVTDVATSYTTAVSERVRQRYVEKKIVPAHRIAVIDNGVNLDRFRPRADQRSRTRASLGWQESFVWLAVGRLEMPKDYPGLIEAFREVHRQFPGSRLAIAGEGRLRPQIEHLIRAQGLADAVSLLGLRSDVSELMNACDAFVMPSAWEGAQLVLLEAAACGRPLVATEVGVAPQVVLPGKTGFLVPPSSPMELAAAMKRVMELLPHQLDEMGQQARRHVADRFSLRSVHTRYRNLYEETLAVS